MVSCRIPSEHMQGWIVAKEDFMAKVELEHAQVAWLVWRSQCMLFKKIGDNGLNIEDVDVEMQPRGLGSHDLVACSLDFEGWMSVELEARETLNMRLSKRDALTRFKQLKPSSGFTRLLLLVHHIKKSTMELSYKALLWNGSRWKEWSDQDFDLPKAVVSKKPLEPLLDSLTWHEVPGQESEVALLTEFTKKMGYKSTRDIKNQVKEWNKTLKTCKVRGKFEKIKIATKQGQKPWCATRDQLKCIYAYL